MPNGDENDRKEEQSGMDNFNRRFQEWLAAGFFEKIWSKGLEQYDELEGIGWEWQSLDGCMVKSPLALESVGKNPTDRGKMGTKRSVLVDEKGLPPAIVISGANTHDIKLLEETLDHIVVLRPEPDEEHPKNLCLDAGYTGSGEAVEQRNYIPHIRPRGEEKRELERNPDFRARRWVVEVTHSFFNRFRKLLVRYEKKAANYMALLQFACAVIVWRKLIRVHR